MKPSDFPRDERFCTPGPAIIDNGVVHLRRYRDVERVLLDTDNLEFSQDASYWATEQRRSLVTHFFWATSRRRANGSPGRHDVLRAIVEPHFRLRAVKALEPVISGHVRDVIREIILSDRNEFNLALELTYPIARRTIMSLVGVPPEHEDWVHEHTWHIGRLHSFFDIAPEPPEVETYLWEFIHARRARPGNALVDVVVTSWDAGVITDVELLASIFGLLVAGYHNTGTNIANTFCSLDEFGLLDEARAHLDDDQWLRHPGEEVLRLRCPFPSGLRTAVTDVTLDCGQTIPAGSTVQLWFSAANRDEAVNAGTTNARSPAVFDITRRPNRHVTFGFGVYRCQGAELARLEDRVALRIALAALPRLHMARDKPFVRHAGVDDGIDDVTFRFDQRAAMRLLT